MKVLVIGASGGFGGAVARALVARGAGVRALVRARGRDPRIEGLAVVAGDATVAADLDRAMVGIDVVVYGLNVPYGRWAREAGAALDLVTEAAAKVGATILFPGNVYGLGPDFDRPLAEDTERQAPTALGRIRNDLEGRLRAASEQGGRVIVLRAGDYFGEGAKNTWFAHLMGKAIGGGALIDPAPPGVLHAWAYLPDVASAAAELLARRHELAPYEEFHFAGHTVTTETMFAAAVAELGRRKVKRFPWTLVRLASAFWSSGRGLVSMRYLWDQPVRLDDSKLRRLLGESYRVTPLTEAVASSLAALGSAQLASAAVSITRSTSSTEPARSPRWTPRRRSSRPPIREASL